MRTLTLDLETTVQTYNKRKASPFCLENWVVASGYKHDDEDTFCNYFADHQGFLHHYVPITPETEVLIGFNIKFDLLYMWSKSELQDYFRRGGRIWDCQYVHYLLQGMQQSSHMVSMDSITEEYGGSLKIDEVKALWEQGIDTPQIPEDLLIKYLKGDVDNTYQIFSEQYQHAQNIHPNFLQMVWNRMDGLLATTEMEYRGLKIDEQIGERDRIQLQSQYDNLIDRLNDELPGFPEGFTFNWKSNYHRSYLLFGGVAKYKEWKPYLDSNGNQLYAKKVEKEVVMVESAVDGHSIPYRYQSGKRMGEIKYKNKTVPDLTKPKGAIQDVLHFIEGKTQAKEEWETALNDGAGNPIYRTSSEVIEELGNRRIPFLIDLAKTQKISKDLTTYYWSEDKNGNRKGMLTLVDVDGRIHHKLNHTSTVTSRLSSSDPNMQNIPRGDKSLVKRMFISRFGRHGRIIEIDYSQLEVIVQGVLSQDKQLCSDIREGIDFHVKRLSAATGDDYRDLKHLHLSGDPVVSAQRTQIKGFTFQRAYGAGVSAIADSTGMSREQVKQLIIAEEAMYPGISAFDASVEEAIHKSRESLGNPKTINGITYWPKQGQWFSPTGTRYIWTEKETPDFMKEQGKPLGFSPTERKNWPVQGLGGEIVQTIIGKIWREFNKQNNFLNKDFSSR